MSTPAKVTLEQMEDWCRTRAMTWSLITVCEGCRIVYAGIKLPATCRVCGGRILIDDDRSYEMKERERGRGIEWKVVSITSKGKRRYRLGRTPKRDRGPARHHVVAGHFKTYTAEAPLLGRAVGTFFWGQFARGSRRAGEIRKVYADRLDTPLLADAIEAHHQGGSDVLNRQRGGGREANREPASPDVIGRPAAVVE